MVPTHPSTAPADRASAGIVLLAAGRSRRFGADKRRSRLPDGRRLLDASLRNALASGLPVVLCLAERDRDDPPATVPAPTLIHFAERADRGMGASLASASAVIPPWHALLVALADMPAIAPASYRSIAAHVAEDRIVVPTHGGRTGHPVAFGSGFFPALRQLDGDQGGRAIVQANSTAVLRLALPDPGILHDVDTPEDLGRAP